ncbi:HNH endonuclease [Rhodococcus sp. D2-41]|uniref:HNH endonuclease family protein n=1 Tax=Speluncibacter jeojiensis TaxID=2710754 RepID=UPI00240F32BA|nr:HNH endonuclease family protein [Rhodococcus sp. D2-41]MDG3012688.1 HNH endonuclease [Rhodococcus sp. D2-41]
MSGGTMAGWLSGGRVRVVAAAALALTVLAGCSVVHLRSSEPAPGSPTRVQVEALLGRVRVVATREHRPGYQRKCSGDQGCVFGPAWTDDSDAPGAHDGCDTRNNVLARSMTAVTYRPGTRNCVVLTGRLADPYSGTTIDFRKREAAVVQIDHVYPLAAAWDMGAWRWDLPRRIRFANDLDYNLLAVRGSDNQDKRDHTPADWLPPNRAYRCFYAGKFLTVAVTYDLPITDGDRRALAGVARGCR